MQKTTYAPVRFLFALVLFSFTFLAQAQEKKKFEPRYVGTVSGNVTMIANNVLNQHPINSYHGNTDNQDGTGVYVDIDGDTSTFNSSSANLTNPEPGAGCLEFVKVYLYWAASDKEAGGSTLNDESWAHNQLKLQLPGQTTYSTITADEVLYRGRDEHFYNDPYVCIKDITNEVTSLGDPYGKYQVANLKASHGGLNPHNGGNFGVAGGWQIVFVYQSPDLTRRNISLFDGYAHVANNQTTEFNIDGFQTIPFGEVKADFVLGVIEGDRVLSGDKFEIRKPDGNWEKLSSLKRGTDNFFNSRITKPNDITGIEEDFINRNPASTNTLGFDASIFKLNNLGNTLIANNQTETDLRATSGSESYGLFLVGLSVEVYEPNLGSLDFTTNPLNSTYDAGETATMVVNVKNSGNDDIRDLELVGIVPPEVELVEPISLPSWISYDYKAGSRELTFTVDDGYTDVDDDPYSIQFDMVVKDPCYFLEGSCTGNFSIQMVATYKGVINGDKQTTNSSGTQNECGFGNHDPSVVTINTPDQVEWATTAGALDRTVSCEDTAGLNAAQSLEPAYASCNFTIQKTSGAFVPAPGCDAIGTYTNTFVFTDACGRESETFTQVITVEDTTAPLFNETLPADTAAAFDNIPAPEILTASDTCDSNPQVNMVESYIGDSNSTTYTIVRTWTASDCAGNTTEHIQKIFVTKNGDPIGLSISDVIVNENVGSALFTISLVGEVAGGFTVDYRTVNAAAVAPADFTALPLTSQFFNGNHAETRTLIVDINDDNIVEATENFTVLLSDLSTTEITINDNEGEATILDNDSATLNISDIDVNEDAGFANVQVILSGFVQEPFSMDYETSSGGASATPNVDYTSMNSQLNWGANAADGAAMTIAVPIINDDFIEITENFLVLLSNLSATGNLSIADASANVNILDNDGGAGTGIDFVNDDVTVNEADGTATFTVTLSGAVQGGFTLDYATADGTAVANGDYDSKSGTLTFAGTDGETQNIVIDINEDLLIEATENFVVNLSNLSTTLIAINDSQANGNITDNDGGAGTGIDFSNDDVTVNEADGTATFSVTLSGAVQGGFTLDYATADGTAVADGDYDSKSGTLTFAGTDGETQNIVIDINEDLLIEETENFVVNLSNLSTTLIAINDNQANGNITDNDGGAGTGIDFANDDVTVNEADGTATFSVTLSGAVQGGFTLDYATADGSAVAGATGAGDYDAASGQLVFAGTDGETQQIVIDINEDLLIEETENFVVNLSNLSTTLIAINDNQATGNITDNDGGAGTGIDFSNDDVTVDEGAGTATFTVTLTGAVQGGFTLDYATADGTAVANGDYDSKSGTLTFAGTDGETQQIVIDINEDLLIEATENFVVNLSNLSTTLIAINDNQATGNITDNDGGAGTGIDFSNDDVTVDEGAGTATFTVTLTGAVQGGFTLDYATADGTAVANGDYDSKSGTLTFAGTDGETQQIVIDINEDLLIEETENFFVNLSNLSTTLIAINDSQANGNITDNDGGAGTGIDFSNDDVTVNEADGTATFSVTLSGAVQGGFTLDYATADGTAVADGDYDSKSGTLTFAGTDGESQNIVIDINEDLLIEETENFVVNLSNLSTTLIAINDNQATGNITDNDGGAGTGIDFVNDDVTVNEADGTATFTVTLSGAVQGGFTLDYATADGTAVANGDYDSKSGTLTFAGTDGETQQIVIDINEDLLIEETENFVVNLSNLSTTLIAINDNQATGNITDNDGGVGTGIDFSNDDVTVNEADGTATFTVTLSGAVQGGFTLDYATADGTAVAGATGAGDYDAASGQLVFAGTDGETQQIVIDINEDLLIEATENFVVNLSNLSTTLIAINDNQATGNITDNDGGAGTGIDFSNDDVTVDEGAGTATFTVTLTGAVQGGFTLDYATADGIAVAGATGAGDYDAAAGQLVFAGTDGETQQIVIDINEDLLIEETENFFVNLSNLSTTLIAINDNQATGNITDNDGGAGTGIDFSNDDVTVNEADGTATFTVTLSGAVQGGFTLDYATADGTAVANGDYDSKSGTLTFAGTDGETQQIVIDINEDLLIEETENFVVNLSNLSTTLIAINDNQATGNITDNDGGAGTGIDFANDNVTVNEADGTATFTVTLSGAVQGGFTLDYATADGSAVAGATGAGDYNSKSGTLTFAGTDGETQQIIIDINEDLLIEETENFVVNLSNLSTTLIAINDSQATGNITDNDGGAGTGIDFSNDNVTVNEADGTATFTVTLTGAVQGGFTLDYATADGTAVANGDYDSKSGTLTFAGTDGETQQIVIDINEDLLIEETENFVVNLSNLSTTLITINDNQATGNIIDNDAVAGTGLDFTATEVNVNEDGISAVFSVVLTGATQDGFSVDFATTDGTAEAPADYLSNAGTLNFAGNDGETHTIEILIEDDNLIEFTESFQLNLSGLTTDLITINTPVANGNILDNDAVDGTGLDFTATDVMINEADGTAIFTVVLTGNVQGGFSVDYTTLEMSATSNMDYTETAGTLSFTGTDGESYDITVPVTDDIIIESTEIFIVRLSNISNILVNINNGDASGTILDNDSTNDFPADETASCDDIPAIAEINLNAEGCAYTIDFQEVISGQDDECATEYSITRTWIVTDCVGNVREHSQVITVIDTEAPEFAEALPTDMTVTCDTVPVAAVLTANDNCSPDVIVVFEETVTNDANCMNGYMITRVWTAADCAGNSVTHTQTIAVPATGPITASAYEEEISLLCGDEIPEVPVLEFSGGCGDYEVNYTEETQFSEDSEDFMIIRSWAVTDACGNSALFEQIIFVLQPALETVSIDICVEDPAIDLVNYLPAGFDTNGTFELVSGTTELQGSTFDPFELEVGVYEVQYTSTGGTCKYYVDFVINVNSDCVPCGRENIIASKTVTANGDGMNDYFEITGVEYCDFSFHVMIFNRWGAKVFDGQNYQNDWGGYSPNSAFGNSGMLPAGTYYYIIEVSNKEMEPINGYIYLGTN
ncbi:Calx-beta domain-containing protein [Zeaxanthinibacter enoshimensis]|nr:Calx-beta domain-containing protein [Zeaxanthinibacter enoshimensis]